MRSAVPYLAVIVAALGVTLPSAAADGWQSHEPATWLQFRAALADVKSDEAKAGKAFTAVAKQTPAQNVAVIELPVDPDKIDVPAAFLVAFGEALEAARSAVAAEPRVEAALQQKGFAADDVLALTKADNGSITVFVGTAS
jgi:hypothetical protein